MAEGICNKCRKLKKDIRYSETINESICNFCYKKFIWKPKLNECSRCGRMLPHHAKGLCRGCYSSVFQLENVKKWNTRLYHYIEPEFYKELTKECVICEFNKIVELHHLDHNRSNNSRTNLVGICPNHHKMVHTKKHQKEIFNILKEKGYAVPEIVNKTDGFFRNKERLNI